MIQTLVFYMFAIITIACGFMVITARNPVHSVLFLILAFFNAAGLFLLQGAEFISMILVIVYVGAVAVLFLFVVMMLDVNLNEMRRGFVKYLPIGLAVGAVLLVELFTIFTAWVVEPAVISVNAATATPAASEVHNTEALGNLIYTHYVYLFMGSGMVLLLAMVGAIVLTLRSRDGVKKQRIMDQIARPASEEVELVKVSSGGGI
ncbi:MULTISPECIES: NADH-quinone oxidoreductase subunit J [Curvivirga]|uniref:NADH-quinone oxidoreductase subunit J n=1 Tax=Curvivirga TaxID=2856846 RepID=UPI0012BC0D53|nr:NADH-quinone oxidoreductase subunit J [Curvivirga aplysinae]MTI09352.1 NADH-quinone oxidoreductase subunit J [Curvivirga aplysinae]